MKLAVALPLVALAAITLRVTAGGTNTEIRQDGSQWVVTISGSAPASAELQFAATGDLTVRTANNNDVRYKITRRLSSQEAAKLAAQEQPLVMKDGQILFAQPGNVEVTVPRNTRVLSAVSRTGAIDVLGIEGNVRAEAFAGKITLDHIGGNVEVESSGGPTVLGTIGGNARCMSAGGGIRAAVIHGRCELETRGGDIQIGQADGEVRALTGGGSIRIEQAGAGVTADSFGGSVTVLHAAGKVNAGAEAGSVEVSDAAGAQCRSRGGSVRLTNVGGTIQAIAEAGGIFFSPGARALRDSELVAHGGDILVELPSKTGVTVTAQTAGNAERSSILSGFPGLEIAREGLSLAARGQINGGGPVLRLTTTAGRIEIRKNGR